MYTNRYTILEPVTEAYYDGDTIIVTTRDISFVLPLNTLTERISADPDIIYELEYHLPTMLLSGIREPGETYLYRLPDQTLFALSRTPAHLNRLFFDGKTLDPAQVVPDMIQALRPEFKQRLQSLPKEYMDLYMMYELKVSYLASSPAKPYLFDPTQQELTAAVGLAMSNDPDYPKLILDTSS